MKRALLILSFLCVGCHDKVVSPTPVPSTPSAAAPAPTPTLARPVIDWETASTADRPGLTATPKRATTAIRLIDALGNVVASLQPGKHFELTNGYTWGWYWLQGQVAGNPQWSDLFAVPIFPNACGGCAEVPLPPPPPAPVCSDPMATRPGCDW